MNIQIASIFLIKEDPLDWESESPQPYSIYGNAHLVIAATLSHSPSSGIFTDRKPTAHFDYNGMGETYNISGKEHVDHNIWISRDEHGFSTTPLHRRVWALTERVAAKRVIHYSPSELVWECKSHIQCECSGIKRPRMRLGYENGVSLQSEVAQAWHSVVCQYTTRQLIKPDIRLSALSGLAKQFASPEMGKYLAGIWHSQLTNALTWKIEDAQKP